MQASIETMLKSYIYDNRSFIIENGRNVAEYILSEAENMDNGWLWFLSDDEIEKFESDRDAKDRMIQEIKDYLKSNYDYEVTEDEE